MGLKIKLLSGMLIVLLVSSSVSAANPFWDWITNTFGKDPEDRED